jgi:hypothetical protein
MAQARGFETLMLRVETKKKFMEAKKKLEAEVGFELTHSQAMEMMCNKILLGSI